MLALIIVIISLVLAAIAGALRLAVRDDRGAQPVRRGYDSRQPRL